MAPDVSQRSYQSRIRNERYQMHSLDGKPLMTWSLPEMGIVELGGVTGKRPPIEGALVGLATIDKLILELQESHPGGTPEGQVQCLRMVSGSFLVDAWQVRKSLGQLADPSVRLEIMEIQVGASSAFTTGKSSACAPTRWVSRGYSCA